MKTIKDSVHDHIEVEGCAADLIDTPPVQRLRRIGQLGTVSLVYPSANHSRFEHSLGVYHIANQALEKLEIGGPQAERVRAAALLHDVGHCPYSHNIESLVHRHTGKYHDDVYDLIESGAVADALDDHAIDPATVAGLVAGEGRLGQLVSGELDVDRMDYLVRDAHHTGVPYGTIDHERFVRELRFIDSELVLAEGNVQTAESLLLARALMNPAVYNHPTARIGRAMLQQATERLLQEDATDAETLRRMDDHALITALRSCDATADYASKLDTRDLYKRAVWAELADVPEWLLDIDHERVRELEREVADEAAIDPERVIFDVPGRPSMPESTSRVVVNGEIRRLASQSTLVRALMTAQRDQWRFGVYAPEGVTDRAGHATERVLGLDLDALVSDHRAGRPATLDEFTGGAGS
jgi:HD superfamily phosphohydrolase